MSTKRSISDNSEVTAGVKRRCSKLPLDSVSIVGVSSLEDLDIKVLQFQNKRLSERLELRRRVEDQLRARIDQLENRKTADDAVLNVVNRYWNQLDENIRILLERFEPVVDSDTESSSDHDEEYGETLSNFLHILSSWDLQDVEHKLYKRVEFSTRYVERLLSKYESLLSAHRNLLTTFTEVRSSASSLVLSNPDTESPYLKSEGDIKTFTDPTETSVVKSDLPQNDISTVINQMLDKVCGEEPTSSADTEHPYTSNSDFKFGSCIKTESSSADRNQVHNKTYSNEGSPTSELLDELKRLLQSNKSLHAQSLKLHERHHTTTLKLMTVQDSITLSETRTAELQNRVDELEYDLDQGYTKIARYERHIDDMRQKLEEAEAAAIASGQQHASTTESHDGESIAKKKFDELKHELNEYVDLATCRLQELEILNHRYQDRVVEVERLKLELKELPENVVVETGEYKCLQSQFSVLYNECLQMKTQLDDARHLLQTSRNTHLKQIEQLEADELTCQKKLRTEMVQLEDQLLQVKKEYDMLRMEYDQAMSANDQIGPVNREMRHLIKSLQTNNQQLKSEIQRYRRKWKESQIEIQKLKAQVPPDTDSSNASDQQKETPKDPAEVEKLLRSEIADLKHKVNRYQEMERRPGGIAGGRPLAEEELKRRIRKLEESVGDLQKSLHIQKQDEEALLNEMEVTTQAFEDMQEQNTRLVQQLQEKDDANFKLLAEQSRGKQLQKLIHEEQNALLEQIHDLQAQIEAQNLVVRKLEEKEKILQSSLATVEKELSLRQQGIEMHKKKAIEASQSAADLRLLLDKYQALLRDAQSTAADKTALFDSEVFKQKRLQEEVLILKRKVERLRKIEAAASADEVLVEEIREYKEQLTCPSCKVKRKDTVLTKCFHVFCMDCLKTRYETRQRKCPKCNAAFGAHDFHRIYLS